MENSYENSNVFLCHTRIDFSFWFFFSLHARKKNSSNFDKKVSSKDFSLPRCSRSLRSKEFFPIFLSHSLSLVAGCFFYFLGIFTTFSSNICSRFFPYQSDNLCCNIWLLSQLTCLVCISADRLSFFRSTSPCAEFLECFFCSQESLTSPQS